MSRRIRPRDTLACCLDVKQPIKRAKKELLLGSLITVIICTGQGLSTVHRLQLLLLILYYCHHIHWSRSVNCSQTTTVTSDPLLLSSYTLVKVCQLFTDYNCYFWSFITVIIYTGQGLSTVHRLQLLLLILYYCHHMHWSRSVNCSQTTTVTSDPLLLSSYALVKVCQLFTDYNCYFWSFITVIIYTGQGLSTVHRLQLLLLILYYCHHMHWSRSVNCSQTTTVTSDPLLLSSYTLVKVCQLFTDYNCYFWSFITVIIYTGQGLSTVHRLQLLLLILYYCHHMHWSRSVNCS